MQILIILSMLFFPCTVFARTIGVPGDASTIQAGIDAASVGDTVLVQPGRYLEAIDFKGKDIVVGSLYIVTRDSSCILNTIIDAQKKNTGVIFKTGETSAAELSGFTITNGLSRGSATNLEPNTGGGICCKNASPYLHHLIIEGNETGLEGGGIYCENSDSVVEYCVIRNNRGWDSGGGVFVKNGNLKIINCLVDRNSSGAISCLYSTILLNKVLIINNRTETMHINSSCVNFIGCTITNNNQFINSFSSDINIVNTIIWDDPPCSIVAYGDPPSHVTIAYSDINGGIDQVYAFKDSIDYTNNIDSDPAFIDVENGNYNLGNNSPCINSGISFYTMRGIELNLTDKQYQGKAPDMGAFESNYTSSIVEENSELNILLSNNPNPFNSITSIHYSISQRDNIKLTIYSVTGQKIIDLVNSIHSVGKYETHWDGKDESGNMVSSGVYIIRMNTGNKTLSTRTAFLK